MTTQQTLVAVLYIVLVALTVHEYWQPELSAIVGA